MPRYRVVRWIEPPQWTLRGVGVGVVLTDIPSIGQAKLGLFGWSKLPSATGLPFVDYGFNFADLLSSTTWTSRDGEMLQAFSKWWNSENKQPTLSVQAALTDLHLKALQTFISQQVPPGWLPPPTGLPSQATGIAQAACLANCEQQHGITGVSPDVASMAACSVNCLGTAPGGGPECSAANLCPPDQDCVNGKCQQKLPVSPSPLPPAPPAAAKSNNTALYVVGGVAIVGLIAAVAMGSKR